MYPHYTIKCTYSQYENSIYGINRVYRAFDFGSPTGYHLSKKPTLVGFFMPDVSMMCPPHALIQLTFLVFYVSINVSMES